MLPAPLPWKPTSFQEFIENFGTSTGAAHVTTDAGTAYLKAMGNPIGPHALASEWVGTQLARLFKLQTFDAALLTIDSSTDEIPFPKGGFAQSGPAFCTRAEAGRPWGGSTQDLDKLDNLQDVTRLVVFDTWIRNRDRHHPDARVKGPNRDNVFLSEERTTPGQYRLVAMDHTHCFTNSEQLDRKMDNISAVKDELIYGLFPEFKRFLRRDVLLICLADLQNVKTEHIRPIVASIPQQWEVDRDVREALIEFIVSRARFLADNLLNIVERDYVTLFQL